MFSRIFSHSPHRCTMLVTTSRTNGVLSAISINNRPIYRHFQENGSRKVVLRKEGEKIRSYVLSRYMQYVENYKKVLEARFPSAMNMYRIFSIGVKDFYKDLKTYIPRRLRYPPTEKNLANFSHQDIELYHKMPRDMWRIAPVLILSAVPFGNYLIFPLALMKPRALLTSHFWSMQQRAEFAVLDLQDRVTHNKDVLQALEANMSPVDNPDAVRALENVLAVLESGVHPTADDVLKCKDLFTDRPYYLKNLNYWHVGHLLRMHGLHRGFFRKKRLHYHAHMIHQMDKAILREGGAEALSTEVLRNACLIRGLNSSHLTNQDMIDWLTQWLTISQDITKESYSLLLHCPLLLAYNHPQNWKLLI